MIYRLGMYGRLFDVEGRAGGAAQAQPEPVPAAPLPAVDEMTRAIVDAVSASLREALAPLTRPAADGNVGSNLRVAPFLAEPRARAPKAKGWGVARCVQALVLGGRGRSALQWLEQNSGGDDDVVRLTRALSTNVGEAGGVLVPPEFSADFIELLRPMTVVRSMGPVVIPMTTTYLSIPGLAGGAQMAYVGENQPKIVTEPRFRDVALSLRELAGIVPVSNRMLRFATRAIDDLIINDMTLGAREIEDLYFIRGSGAGNTPRGLRFLAAADNVFALQSQATPSLTKVHQDLASMVGRLEDANMPNLRPGWIMAPRTRRFISTLYAPNGNVAFPDIIGPNPTLMGYPVRLTTQIPVNLGAGDESEIYFVEFSNIMVGEADGIQVDISDQASYDVDGVTYHAFQRNQTLIRVEMMHDISTRYPEAIVVGTGVDWV
jgi:HK97 family phage major capsid protein